MEILRLIIFFDFPGTFPGSGGAAGRAARFLHSGSLTGRAVKQGVAFTGIAGENSGPFAVGAGHFSGILAERTGTKGKKTGKDNRKNEKHFFHIHSFVK